MHSDSTSEPARPASSQAPMPVAMAALMIEAALESSQKAVFSPDTLVAWRALRLKDRPLFDSKLSRLEGGERAVLLRRLSEEAAAGEPPATAGRPPLDIFRSVPTPDFDESAAPPAIWRLASTFAAASGFDPSGLVVAATVAAASMIDDRLRLAVQPASGWFESARLWAVLIGGPGAAKTPVMRAATDPVRDLHRDLIARWADETAGLPAEGNPKPALYTSDSTTEKLAELLRDNPRGMLLLTEEFSSWIGSIDCYRDTGAGRDRGAWLQAFDGGPLQIDRIKRGSFLVPNWSLSVLSAATPAGLRQHARQLVDDGLIHRFLFCVLRRPEEPDGARSARAEMDAWSRLLRGTFEATTRPIGAPTIRLSTNARALFDAERRVIKSERDAVEELCPALCSHLAKNEALLARVALTFHVIDQRAGDAVEADTMRQAISFMRAARRHAAAVFAGVLNEAPALRLARALALSVLAGRLSELSRAAATHACRAWRGAAEADQRAAMQLLDDANWVIPDPGSRAYGGWSATRWIVNGAVHDLFGEHGRQHAERRAAVRALLEGETP